MDSWYGKPDDTSTISRQLPAGEYCLNFWYMMYGNGIEKLQVYTTVDSTDSILWSEEGDKYQEWYEANITLKLDKDGEVRIRGHPQSLTPLASVKGNYLVSHTIG